MVTSGALVKTREKDGHPLAGIIGKLTQCGYTRRHAREFLACLQALNALE